MAYNRTRDGTDIFVKGWGSGRPVILTHGWPLAADMGCAGNGARKGGLSRHDLPPAGLRAFGTALSGYDYGTFADDLADVMQETGATIVGFSMGGGEVERYMSRHDGKGLIAAGLVSSIVPYMLEGGANRV